MTYPGAITTFTPKTDAVDDVMAADVNELQTDITAIETTLGVDPQGNCADVVTRLGHTINADGILQVDAPSSLTISAGAVTATQTYHTIDTEGSAATDDLDTINGGADGQIIIIRQTNQARTVVIKHNVGNIYTKTAGSISLNAIETWAWGIYDAGIGVWFIQ